MKSKVKTLLSIKSAIFIIIQLLFLLSSPVDGLAERRSVSLATGEWPPYVSEYLVDNGMAAELVAEVFKEVGIEVSNTFYPWTRALLSVEKGGCAGSYPWRKEVDREEFGLFSDELFSTEFMFFYYKNKFQDNESLNAEKVYPYIVGVPLGYAQLEDLKKRGYRCKVITNSANGILMLLKGHIDFLAEAEAVGDFLIRQLLMGREDEFGKINAGLSPKPMRLIISKHDPDAEMLLEKFNKGLKKIKASGKYSMIMEKHEAMY
ncbi:ABC transporter substrate-binding protein [Desulfovibrio sp. JC010]|uniref:substrate-binding periplasmic protein n=1 Tax=Desulfovibrio sp. JC010 TaxID=2593641 RepID=UPI0013D0B3A3|nr:transporter substrate-binding domain-containing protein [Desulfovibrio sp. JC010]NDV25887.1 amino acid ABC transporter substrate-binding protein [Desulfovibrio sp. JC010]